MIDKLPRWIWAGAWALAFVTGFVNVVTLLDLENQAVSHLTGTSSMLAASLASFDGWAVARLTAVIGAFVAGAIISGCVIRDGTLKLGHRYSIALLLEALLLLAAVPLLELKGTLGLCAAAAACGLQNAMVTTYSGAVVRTTHLSGIFTDLGILLGHILVGIAVDMRRIWLYLCIVSAFVVGGVVGAVFSRYYGYPALIFPAVLNLLAAAVYSGYVLGKQRTAPLAA